MNIVNETFDIWTKDLNPKEKRISIFNHIRDITYKIIPNIRTSIEGPVKILEYMSGSCTPKHFLLGKMFEMIDMPIKYISVPFSWNNPNVNYPNYIRKLAEKTPIEYHLACKTFIENKWRLIDATWDLPLEKVGFLINKNWDGISETKCAVIAIDEVEHNKAIERDEFVKKMKSSWSSEDHKITTLFVDEINKWLEQVRKS